MEQLALPYRIALIAVLAACALWFVALRPKADSADSTPLPTPSAATAPGVKGLGNAVAKAKGAVATSDAAAKASEQAADAASTGSTLSSRPSTAAAAAPAATKPAATKPAATKAKPAAPAATKPAATKATPAPAAKPKANAAPTDRSAPLLAALAKGRVAVVLFLDARAADDKAVRSAVREATKGRAKVIARIASISDVGDYAAITQGVAVGQSPTVIIIGPDKKAQALTGYVDAASIAQAITQAR